MPPRKRAAAPLSRIPHADFCLSSVRVERFPVPGSDGPGRTVTRCLECGAQLITDDQPRGTP